MENLKIVKLKGSSNWNVWILQINSLLAERQILTSACRTIEDEAYWVNNVNPNIRALGLIRLNIEPGPLIQTQHETLVNRLVETLRNLYAPVGFSADFLLCKELFTTSLANSSNMESYLNRIKRVHDELTNRSLAIPNKVIAAYTLNGLGKEYDYLASMLSQSYRSNQEIELSSMFSQLLDESRRINASKNRPNQPMEDVEMAMNSHNGNAKPKKAKCGYCNKPGHAEPNCFAKYPEKRPKKATPRGKQRSYQSEEVFTCIEQAYIAEVGYNSSIWHLDSGATKHICADIRLFSELEAYDTTLKWGSASAIHVTQKGNIRLKFTSTNVIISLSDVLFVPKLGINLLSVGQLVNKDASILSSQSKTTIKRNGRLIAYGYPLGSLITIEASYPSIVETDQALIGLSADTIHQRMGHIGDKALKALPNHIDGTTAWSSQPVKCDVCVQAKATRHVNRSSPIRTSEFLEKVHSDICGPIKPQTLAKNRYFVTFIDDKTRWADIALLRSRDQLFSAFTAWQSREELQSGSKLKRLHSDNAFEYKKGKLADFLQEKGILGTYTAPYTPEQNGVAERMNLTLLSKARAWLIQSGLSKSMWGEAISAAIYVYNRTPHSNLPDNQSPFEARYGSKPNLDNIRIFGSICWKTEPLAMISKLDPRASLGIITGFGNNQWRVVNPTNHKASWHRDVVIREGIFLKDINKDQSDDISDEDLVVEPVDPGAIIGQPATIGQPVIDNVSQPATINTGQPVIDDIGQPATTIDSETATFEPLTNQDSDISLPDEMDYAEDPYSEDPNVSYWPNNDFVDQLNDYAAAYDDGDVEMAMPILEVEPTTYNQAVNSPNAAKWQAAMLKEVNELKRLGSWMLVPLPANRKAVRGKWVYKIKRATNKEPVFKARWVVKGFQQKPGIDFTETFASTLNLIGYRLLLILGTHLDWEIRHWDVKNAYPNADITEELYTEQPIGFIEGNKNLVCRVKKALNGLKQAAREWQTYLRMLLGRFEFSALKVDQNVFIGSKNGCQIAIGAYVDDLLVVGQDLSAIQALLDALNEEITINDLGEASTFLGIDIHRNRQKRELFLTQEGYINRVLDRFGKKPTNKNPAFLPKQERLKPYQGKATPDEVHEYQAQIGSLIYAMTKTRPDLAYPVGSLARYMSNPGPEHQIAMDKLLRYLEKSANLGIRYQLDGNQLDIAGYVDSDWGGDLENRRSTSAYLFTVNGASLSWTSKLQKTTALSSTEAEYMALKEAVKELLYIRQLCRELAAIAPIRTGDIFIRCDSQSAMDIAKNPTFHYRTKHIDIQYHFVREHVTNGTVRIKYIPTDKQLADGLTKPISQDNWVKMLEGLYLRRPT